MRSALLLLCIACSVLLPFLRTARGQTQTPDPPPPSTDVFLADTQLENGQLTVGTPINVTRRTGYDNQPYFLSDGSGFFYVSIREDEQADVYLYRLKDSTSSRVTSTEESEYSPTVMPDGKYFSVVRVEKDEAQRLWKFPLQGGEPALLAPNVKPVGYHCWIDSENVVVFILGEPHTLQITKIPDGVPRIIAESVGRSIHMIPFTRQISYIHKKTEQEWWIEAYDIDSGERRALIRTLPGSEDFVWISDTRLWMAQGSKMYQWTYPDGGDWVEVADFSPQGLKGITRIAVSRDRTRMAVVAEE